MNAGDRTAGPYRPNLGDFRPAAAAVARAYADDVPTFAPTLFATALDLWNRAQRDAAAQADATQVARLLAEVEEVLNLATERAGRNREVLSEVAHLRREGMRNNADRFYAAELLSDAEHQYQVAVAAAEVEDTELAAQTAGQASDLFHAATIQSLERGVLDHVEQALTDTSVSLPMGARRDLGKQLDELREAFANHRDGTSSTVALERGTAALVQRFEDFVPHIGPGDGGGGGGDDVVAPPDVGWAPGTFGAPEAPLEVRIGERTANSLVVSWLNRLGGRRNFLVRQRAGGPWEVAAEFGVLSGWTSYTDSGLDPDTTYRYGVRAEGNLWSSSTPMDRRAYGHTRGAPAIAVWRLQLRVRTADIADAGSDNDLQVRLNSPIFNYEPNSNSTWMDYGPRFQQGS